MRPALASIALFALLGACATTQEGAGGIADRDPRERFNRGVWDFNQGIDEVVLAPVSEVYRAVTPRPARRGLSRIIDNLSEPWSFVNNLLQGKPERAINNLGRFIVNSTIGVGGLADHATDLGIAPSPEDFGQTLASWGVGDGGYLMTPLLGPSTARDTIGSIVGFIADPVGIFNDQVLNLTTQEQWAMRGVVIVDTRSRLAESGYEAFLETSADPYAAARSAFFQRREAELLDYDTGGLSEGDVEASEDAAFDAALEELEEQPATTPEPAPTAAEPGAAPPPETEPDAAAGIEPEAPAPEAEEALEAPE